MARHVTFGDFMAGNFLAGDFLGGYLEEHIEQESLPLPSLFPYGLARMLAHKIVDRSNSPV